MSTEQYRTHPAAIARAQRRAASTAHKTSTRRGQDHPARER